MELEAREAYRRIAAEYDRAPNPMVALEQRIMPELLGQVSGLCVADVASGTGRWAAHCANRGAHAVAIDFCAEMLERGPRPAILAEANLLPLRDGWADLAICAFAAGYAPGCMAELARVTRQGGSVFVSDVHPEGFKRGWKRSFRADTEAIEVAHAVYLIGELSVPGLELVRLLEPRFGDPERAIFAAAGKLEQFDEASREAAIFVAQWKRTG